MTPAGIQFLNERNVPYQPFQFDYLEGGGTSHSSEKLGVPEHQIIKSLVFETPDAQPFMILMHGDLQVDARAMGQVLGVKKVNPVKPERAFELTGYKVGGISPFGIRNPLPIYAEASIFDLPEIFINAGQRGYLVKIASSVLKDVVSAIPVSVRRTRTT